MVTFCQQIVLVQMLSNWNVTIINKKTNKSSTKSALETNKLTRIESKHSRHKIHEKNEFKEIQNSSKSDCKKTLLYGSECVVLCGQTFFFLLVSCCVCAGTWQKFPSTLIPASPYLYTPPPTTSPAPRVPVTQPRLCTICISALASAKALN